MPGSCVCASMPSEPELALLCRNTCSAASGFALGGDAKGRNGENVWLCLDMKEGASLHFMPADEPPAPDEMLLAPNARTRKSSGGLEKLAGSHAPDLRRALAGIMDERDQWALLGRPGSRRRRYLSLRE